MNAIFIWWLTVEPLNKLFVALDYWRFETEFTDKLFFKFVKNMCGYVVDNFFNSSAGVTSCCMNTTRG